MDPIEMACDRLGLVGLQAADEMPLERLARQDLNLRQGLLQIVLCKSPLALTRHSKDRGGGAGFTHRKQRHRVPGPVKTGLCSHNALSYSSKRRGLNIHLATQQLIL